MAYDLALQPLFPLETATEAPPSLFSGLNAPPVLFIFHSSKPYITSQHVPSVKVQAVCRMLAVKFTVSECYDEQAPDESLPFIITPTKLIKTPDVLDYIYSISEFPELCPTDLANSTLLAKTTDLHLSRAIDYVLQKPSTKKISEWYASRPPPLNYILPYLKRKQIQSNLRNSSLTGEIDGAEIVRNAEETFKCLSTFLGTKSYFFAEFGEIDATVFAYLHVILSMFDEKEQVRVVLMNYENLVNFAKRMWNTWFL